MMNKNCSFLWFVFINFWLTSTAKYLNVLFLNYFQINSTCCSLSGSSYDKRQIRYETPIRKYDFGARTGSGLALFKFLTTDLMSSEKHTSNSLHRTIISSLVCVGENDPAFITRQKYHFALTGLSTVRRQNEISPPLNSISFTVQRWRHETREHLARG